MTCCESGAPTRDFNPRSHERSDPASEYRKNYDKISIHAPTRGATTSRVMLSLTLVFQSTLPREERPFFIFLIKLSLSISIHAPTRGATFRTLADIGHLTLFQSTLPREERHSWHISPLNPVLISIHAPTRGATFGGISCNKTVQFQSTLPREERLATPSSILALVDISIHAPTRGATKANDT